MALVGMSSFEETEFVSEKDPCRRVEEVPIDPEDPDKGTKSKVIIDEGATVFKIAPLDVFLQGQILDKGHSVSQDTTSGEAGINLFLNKTRIETVRYGLRGWENFLDQQGKVIEFKSERSFMSGRKYLVVSDECMNALDIGMIEELAEKIRGLTQVTQGEAKN